MTSSRSTPRKRPCAYCRSIRDMLKPTMDARGGDSVIAVFTPGVVERIYANAKKGASTNRKKQK